MVQITTPYSIGKTAVEDMIAFCQQNNLSRFFMVADDNTYPLLGERVQKAMVEAGIDVKPIILHGQHIIADEATLVKALIATGSGDDRYFVSVGSGTLTDITRFVSHRTRSHFISMPTAPSVDGFLSPGSPLVIDSLKQTISGHVPMGIFADIDTLREAPRDMLAAGYADMLGKLTSLVDWRLSHLLWNEGYDASLHQWTWDAVMEATTHTEDIAKGGEQGITTLMEALLKTGQVMVEFGNSNPASGTEHHLSHFWEMKLLTMHRPPVLHGAKVGVGMIWAARRYEKLRSIDRTQLLDLLEASELPDEASERQVIQEMYGPAAEQATAKQEPFLTMTPADFDALKQRILENWDEIHELADQLPSSQQITEWIELVGGPTDIKQLGFSAEEERLALDHAHFFRNRFTANKLFHVLGLRMDATQW